MKSDTIQFGNFSVPLQEFASQGNAILGIRDSGKSYTATLLTRERKKTKAVGFPDMLACAKVLRVVPPSLGRASTNRGSFSSRSCSVEHFGHCQRRTSSGNSSSMWPQQLHRFDDGKNRSILTMVRPCFSAL